MTIKIIKRKSSIYDVYADGEWIFSRTSADSVFVLLQSHMAEHGPATIEFEDQKVMI